MLDFEFSNKTTIVFGKDSENRLGELTKSLGKKVLLHYGGGSIKKFGLYDKVIHNLEEAGLAYVELGGVKANPRLSLVREGIDLCKSEGVDFILAVGGGSVIDSAKAIAAGFYYKDDVWDLYTGKGVAEKCLPIGVVLTIPAAGSETSGGTVITNDDGHYKKAFGNSLLRPVFAVMNPELTYTLPDYQTACGATDMLAHVFERYFTRVEHVTVTDRLSEGLMKAIVELGPKLLAEPNNYDYRAEIMWAGTLAHNDLVGTGRQDDWGSHDIEHELSGIYDIAHGAGLSIIFPAWMKYVYKTDLPRFAQWANRVFDIEVNTRDLEETALKGISALEAFYQSIGMPIRLAHAGIVEDRYEEMANKATDHDQHTLGSFVKLRKADIVAIYQLAK